MIYTLWADDLITLRHGIGRTLAPLVMKNRFRVVVNLFIIFFVFILPLFVFFPVTLSIAVEKLSPVGIFKIPFHFHFYLLIVNLIFCIMLFILVSRKCKDYGTNPIYSVLGIFGSVFVFIACLYSIANLLVFGKSKSIVWQDRQYTHIKDQEGFAM